MQLDCFFSLYVYIFYENIPESVLSAIFLHMMCCNEYYKYWKKYIYSYVSLQVWDMLNVFKYYFKKDKINFSFRFVNSTK